MITRASEGPPTAAEQPGVADHVWWIVDADPRRRGPRVQRGPRRTTARNPAGLTSRQLDVLLLIAEGLSNAQISQRLWLSTRTVGHHVSAVLCKLAVDSRGQAAVTAFRLGLMDHVLVDHSRAG